MKYDVGQKVRIKSLDWYNENKDNYGAVYAGNGFAFWNYMAGLCGEIMTISSIKVDPEDSNKGYYFMENSEEKWTDEMIEGLVEEENKPNIIEEAKTYWDSNKDAWICPEGYIFKDENGNIINATKIVLEKKKKEYPKTYEGCCKVLRYTYEQGITMRGVTEEEGELFRCLIVLKRCRDAYWKIAGEEMGLGKPWEPDWSIYEHKFCLGTDKDKVIEECVTTGNRILAFPTEEMRDAFKENFKELIEQCKELL